MSNNCGCDTCNCPDSLPKGDQGEPGQPSFLALSFISSGVPASTSSITYVELGRFPFSNTIADPFTGIKFNVYVSAGTGSYRIKDLVSSNVIYENTNVTSASAINIETVTGIDIYDVANALIVVEVLHNTGGADSIKAGGISFYYE